MITYNSFYTRCLVTGLFSMILFLASCKKFLDEKPDGKLATPATFNDLDGMLDLYSQLNARYPSAAEVCADNYYLTNADWAAVSEPHRNYYLWQKFDETLGEWLPPFNNIFYANVILHHLPDISCTPGQVPLLPGLKGSALFLRAYYFYALSQLFAPAYDPATATTDLGLPLRLNPDVNERSVRSSVQQTYDQILSDLQQAVSLLPVQQPRKHRPSKPAAYAMLARTFLVMREYQKAGLYADSCLQLYDSLINYNTLNASATIPFTQFNKEVIYDCRSAAPSALSQTRAKVDSSLYNSYTANDIRKTIFFRSNGNGTYAFKGNYTGLNNASLFTGIAVDEIYLIRAEARARAGNITLAMQDLNKLLAARWRTGTFIDFTAANANEALILILKERRKELLFRGLRWSDLRRLNKEQQFETTLTRLLNNQQYQLPPNSLRYTLQIDHTAIQQSGMQQNP